jgi:hypothetical protein
MMLSRAMSAGAIAVVIAACGGKVVVDQGSGSTSATASGAGGSNSSVATSSATGDSGCPPMVPAPGSPCPNEKEICTYGMLCGVEIVTCQNGMWTVTGPECPAMPCPSPPPKAGDPCPGGPAKCDYDLCDSASPSTVEANCNNGAWSVTAGACPATCPPGFCGPNQTCIIETNGKGVETFGCGADPCNGALDCACAKQLCPQGSDCAVVDATTIACSCATCP